MEVAELKKNNPRFRFMLFAVLIFAVALFAGCSSETQPAAEKQQPGTSAPAVYKRAEVVTSPADARKLLEEGNKRFVEAKEATKDLSAARRQELVDKGQKPFAVVVTCSDSRVPAETIFDQGLGDIFVVRTAGNVVDPITVGSVEYGAEHLAVPLVVVMGHEKCGAVKATVDGGEAAGSIGSIVSEIKPSLDKAKAAGVSGDALYEKTTDENVAAVIAELEKSPILKHLQESGKLNIVGAKYHLSSGQVSFFPAAAPAAGH